MPRSAQIVLTVLLLSFGLAWAWTVRGFSDWVEVESGSKYIAALACLAGVVVLLLIAWLIDRRARRRAEREEAERRLPPPPNFPPRR